jgi:hypothetical protein
MLIEEIYYIYPWQGHSTIWTSPYVQGMSHPPHSVDGMVLRISLSAHGTFEETAMGL